MVDFLFGHVSFYNSFYDVITLCDSPIFVNYCFKDLTSCSVIRIFYKYHFCLDSSGGMVCLEIYMFD